MLSIIILQYDNPSSIYKIFKFEIKPLESTSVKAVTDDGISDITTLSIPLKISSFCALALAPRDNRGDGMGAKFLGDCSSFSEGNAKNNSITCDKYE